MPQNQPGMAFSRGVAAIVATSFGFVWLGWGLSVLRALPVVVWILLCCIAAALIVTAVIAVRRGKRLMRGQGTSRRDLWEKRRKPFGVVTLFEVVGCIVVVVLANIFRRADWVGVGISLVVGLHFLPLGRIFEATAYYWVGALIVVWDILAITALKWNLTASAGIATGVILWAAAINVVVRSFHS